MILSVIIVNYRVRYFLELCLHSVQRALQEIDSEVIVVDNHSEDESVAYLRPLFPGVTFIVNTENKGFSRANNQALAAASGKYILFLNPDTILPEDIATRCLSFLEATPGIGGLGVRMLDGSGLFLKESRRGFPSPWVAFCKLSGLTALFPHSRLFATYYLGYLSETRTHPAPVLSGACLWVARAVLEKTGGFDERFFMYAEDIDLSYRIELAGFLNYYMADTTIVHFKGESTLKDIRYIKQFYKAMSQFRRKHFRKGLPALFNVFMELAIWLRAGISAAAAGTSANPAQPPGIIKTHLAGDPSEARRLAAEILRPTAAGRPSGQRTIVPAPGEADELIFCEGVHYSFKECIAALEAAASTQDGKPIKFYAKGSGVVVGSTRKDGQGDVLVISAAPGRL